MYSCRVSDCDSTSTIINLFIKEECQEIVVVQLAIHYIF